MEIKEILKKDDAILKVLAVHNVDRINRVICNTNQGALELEIRKGEQDYHMVLGAVPLNQETSRQLLDLLFPIPKMEEPKQVNKEAVVNHPEGIGATLELVKKKGRPAKIDGKAN